MDRRLYSLAIAMIVLTACLGDFGSALPAGEGGYQTSCPPEPLVSGAVR